MFEEKDPDGAGSAQERLTSRRSAGIHDHLQPSVCEYGVGSCSVTTDTLMMFDCLDLTDRGLTDHLICVCALRCVPCAMNNRLTSGANKRDPTVSQQKNPVHFVSSSACGEANHRP